MTLVGWILAQAPFLVPPTLTVSGAAAHPATLKVLLVALVVGAPILGPSLFLLFRVFHSRGRDEGTGTSAPIR